MAFVGLWSYFRMRIVHGGMAWPEPVPEKKHSFVPVVTGAMLSIVWADADNEAPDVCPGFRYRCIFAGNTIRA